VAGELTAAGSTAPLAGPADTAALRGTKRPGQDRQGRRRQLRAHLMAGDLPGSWVPPEHVLKTRAPVRLYKDLLDGRGGWQPPTAATLFHQGAPLPAGVAVAEGRVPAEPAGVSAAGRQAVGTGLRRVERRPAGLDPLRRRRGLPARRPPGCRALRAAP
jgi:transposase